MNGWKTIVGGVLAIAVAIGEGIGAPPLQELPAWGEAVVQGAIGAYVIWARFAARGEAAPQLRRLVRRER